MKEITLENLFYSENKNYYERNAQRYESASWYFFNGYKDKAVSNELKVCLSLLEHIQDLAVLEIGPGSGYLLNKLKRLRQMPFSYTGIEHSKSMSDILFKRYDAPDQKLTIHNQTVTQKNLTRLLKDKTYHLIMGSSILHHLLDYRDVILELAGHLEKYGVLYFVREPIHKNEIAKSTPIEDCIEIVYRFINAVYMTPALKRRLFPGKVKAEDASQIAYHMFKDGVSMEPFMKLRKSHFKTIFIRKYNRRASTIFSFIENQFLKKIRKDVFGNTLFSIGMQKTG